MDQFVVDLGPGPVDVAEGDEAILFGPGAAGEPTAQDWADLLGTIHYEVVTSPRGRVVRTYRREPPSAIVGSRPDAARRRAAGATAAPDAARAGWRAWPGWRRSGTVAGVSAARAR